MARLERLEAAEEALFNDVGAEAARRKEGVAPLF